MGWLSKFKKKKTTSDPIEVMHIDGHSFRVLDPVKMNNIRRVRFFWEDYVREWGMTKEDILAYVRMCMKETAFPTKVLNLAEQNAELADRLKHCYSLLSTLDAVITEDYQYKPFLKSACIIVLMDDEKEDEIDSKTQSLKLQLCRDNPEIEAFFLRVIRTFQLSIAGSLDISELSSWYPSEKLKGMESSIYAKIGSTIY